MYAGTRNNGRLYRSFDGKSWPPAASFANNNAVNALELFNGRLYAGDATGKIWASPAMAEYAHLPAKMPID